jgi:hypothetical protein
MIEKLRRQLSYIMSFLGITETVDETNGDLLSEHADKLRDEPRNELANYPANGTTSEPATLAIVVRRRARHQRKYHHLTHFNELSPPQSTLIRPSENSAKKASLSPA